MKNITTLVLIAVSLFSIFAQGNTEAYDNAQMYSTGSFEIDANNIDDFEIHWTSGDITVSQTDTDKLIVNTDNPDIHWLEDNGKLVVRFCGSESKQSSKVIKYQLNIEVPDKRKFDLFNLELGIGNANLDSVKCTEFNADISVGDSIIILSDTPERMNIKVGTGDLSVQFPENTHIKIKAPFGIGGRDISDNFTVVKESDIAIEMGVGNLTIR